MANLEKINFKETTSKTLMRYHFFIAVLGLYFTIGVVVNIDFLVGRVRLLRMLMIKQFNKHLFSINKELEMKNTRSL